MKGILLAGGQGTRLHPLTAVVNKQLLPVYDKPMVYYALSTLLWAGIREVLIISTPRDMGLYQQLLGTGEALGCGFEYAVQHQHRGIAEAFDIGAAFVGNESVGLILGDNIFYGAGFTQGLPACTHLEGGIIFAKQVDHPQRYGIVALDKHGRALSIEEKPQHPKSTYAIPGLYFFDNTVFSYAQHIRPSARGELEITDIHQQYLQAGTLQVRQLAAETVWLDAGTMSSLQQASAFVQVLQARQGLYIGCIEEVAYRMEYIDAAQLARLAAKAPKSDYGQYVRSLLP